MSGNIMRLIKLNMNDDYNDKIIIFILMLYFFYMAAVIGTIDLTRVNKFFVDDSYYYLVMARNILEGYGATFDKINPTNGYHPLWLIILTIIYWPFWPFTPEFGQLLVFATGITIVISGALLFLNLIRRFKVLYHFEIPFLIVWITIVGFQHFGLETHMQVLLAGLFLSQAWKCWDDISPSQNIILGIAGSLLVLARLDSMLLVLCILMVLLLHRVLYNKKVKFALWDLFFTLLPLFTLVGGYFLYNKINFGHWTTISSSLKMGTFGPKFALWHDFTIGIWARFAVLFGLSCMTLGIAASHLRHGVYNFWGSRSAFVTAIAISVMSYCFLMLFLITDGLGSWYFTLPLVICLLMFVIELTNVSDRFKLVSQNLTRFSALISVIFLSLSILLAMRNWPSVSFYDASEFKKKLATHINDKTIVFQVDRCGTMAWFNECRLINGDGVMSSWEYQTYISKRRVTDFLDIKKVEFIIDTYPPDKNGIIWIKAQEWGPKERREFPILGFRETDALITIGDTRLFRYPGNSFKP